MVGSEVADELGGATVRVELPADARLGLGLGMQVAVVRGPEDATP